MNTKQHPTAAQRKALERARKREQGLIQREYWVLPEQRPRLDNYVAKLARERELMT